MNNRQNNRQKSASRIINGLLFYCIKKGYLPVSFFEKESRVHYFLPNVMARLSIFIMIAVILSTFINPCLADVFDDQFKNVGKHRKVANEDQKVFEYEIIPISSFNGLTYNQTFIRHQRCYECKTQGIKNSKVYKNKNKIMTGNGKSAFGYYCNNGHWWFITL